MPLRDLPAAAAFLTMLRRFRDFSARTPRTEYWLAAAVTAALLIILLPVLLIPVAGAVLYLLAFCFLAVPFLAVTARRLHDVSRSAWWLLAGIFPVLGLGVLIFFTVRPGDQGDNLYGASPEPVPQY